MALKPPLANTSSPRNGEPHSSDTEKLRKWHQDRISRKLRGEYETAVLHLAQMVTSSLDTPLNVASVRVEGAVHTRKSFLSSLIQPLRLSDTTTLEGVLHTARRISHILHETHVFKSIEAKIETSRHVLAQEGDVDIVFKTTEKGRFFLNTSTEVGNGEGNANITGRVRNVFGGAETLEANLSLGTTTRRSFHALLALPLTRTLKTRGEMSIFGLERDNTSYASSTEGLRGFKAVVRGGTMAKGIHQIGYEAVVRRIGNLTPTASLSMREAAGHSLKSSISHTWTKDTRDDRFTATRGYYSKFFHELAGLGGDAKFYRVEAEGHLSRPIFDGVTVSFAARTGMLWSLGGTQSLWPDRFQLGGPTNLRAFRANSMGPRDGSDSLGGDMYWTAGLSLISNIPHKGHWPVKTHAWINAGRLDNINRSLPLQINVSSCLTKPSISAGVGLIYRFDSVRVEVNFGVPLVASKSDGGRRGLQVGMGLEFL